MAIEAELSTCPFCSVPAGRVVLECSVAVGVADACPVAEGHTLVVPRAHVGSIYELPADQQAAIWQFVGAVRQQLIEQYGVKSFNIGVNDGTAAGQTVQHAHIHVIPRRPGDVPDPRGGIRWIITDKAKYWE